MQTYTIYKATNLVNGRAYIGYDSKWPARQKDHLRNYDKLGHGHYNSYFHRAIRKYGPDAFVWEVLFQARGDSVVGKWMLNIIEPKFIEDHKTTTFEDNHFGYNMTLGGEGSSGASWNHTEASKRKIGDKMKVSMMGHTVSAETRTKIASKQAKTYMVTFPDGHTEIVVGLNAFAKQHNLSKGSLSSVATGKIPEYKGYVLTLVS